MIDELGLAVPAAPPRRPETNEEGQAARLALFLSSLLSKLFGLLAHLRDADVSECAGHAVIACGAVEVRRAREGALSVLRVALVREAGAVARAGRRLRAGNGHLSTRRGRRLLRNLAALRIGLLTLGVLPLRVLPLGILTLRVLPLGILPLGILARRVLPLDLRVRIRRRILLASKDDGTSGENPYENDGVAHAKDLALG